jgi:hypothetical protein
MPEHKFKIGERLFLVRSIALTMPGEAYVVMKRLPKHDGEFACIFSARTHLVVQPFLIVVGLMTWLRR